MKRKRKKPKDDVTGNGKMKTVADYVYKNDSFLINHIRATFDEGVDIAKALFRSELITALEGFE